MCSSDLIGIISNERTIADEVRREDELVPMRENRKVGFPPFVPLRDCFINGNVQPAHAALILQRVSVVKLYHHIVDREVGVVSFGNEKLQSFLMLEVECDISVHQCLPAFPLFGRELVFWGTSSVISRITGNDVVELRVLQEKLDARDEK